MKTVLLTRYGSTPMGTFGKLIAPGLSCFTVEKEWRNNEPQVSCIPLGTYECSLVDSPKFGQVYEVKNVVGRSHILIHAANCESELLGCIALGDALGYVKNQWAVLNSKATLANFMRVMNGEDFILSIQRAA